MKKEDKFKIIKYSPSSKCKPMEKSPLDFFPSYGSHFKIMISKLIINRINVNFSIKRMRIGFYNSARAAITPEIDLQLPAYSFLIA